MQVNLVNLWRKRGFHAKEYLNEHGQYSLALQSPDMDKAEFRAFVQRLQDFLTYEEQQ